MNAIAPEPFLREYWQKKPLFLRQFVPQGVPAIDADELAWLATLADVESRLVFTEHEGGRRRYRVEHGPFDDGELEALPDRDWTLLVNDVEKHLPALRRIVELIDFVPDWRVDDLMISFAAPGGGVGPHRDNYDVFLCQGEGTRRWVYTSDSPSPDPDASDDIALVKPFDAPSLEATPGDVLYLPPGIAHWGTATSRCLTYSIGMRAPRLSDLLGETPGRDPDPFYVDPDLQCDEAVPGLISERALDRAAQLVSGHARLARDEVADRLGCYVTSPKHWLRPDPDDTPLDRAHELVLHGMGRIAFDSRRVYANGASRTLAPDQRELIRKLCRDRRLDREKLPNILSSAPNRALISWMMRQGALESGGADT